MKFEFLKVGHSLEALAAGPPSSREGERERQSDQAGNLQTCKSAVEQQLLNQNWPLQKWIQQITYFRGRFWHKKIKKVSWKGVQSVWIA